MLNKRRNKFYLSLNELLAVLLISFLLIFFIFCGFLQVSNNLFIDNCNMALLSLAHSYFKNNISISFFGLFFSILLFFAKIKKNKIKKTKDSVNIFNLKVFDIVFKLNNRIFQAFRRGIIHNQVYYI